MKKLITYLLILATSFCATHAIQKVSTNKIPLYENNKLPDETTLAENIAISVNTTEHPNFRNETNITNSDFEKLLNETVRNYDKKLILDIFDEWVESNAKEAIKWLESRQSLIAKYPEIFTSISLRTQSVEDFAMISKQFLYRYQPQILSSFVSIANPNERLSVVQSILPHMNQRYKAGTLAEMGKLLLPSDLDSLITNESLSATDISYLASGISTQLPASGDNNRFDWLLGIGEKGYNLPICLHLAIKATIEERNGQAVVDFLDSLTTTEPDLADSLIRQNERKIRSHEPILSLDLLSRHGSDSGFSFTLKEAYSLDPNATRKWLDKPDNQELAEFAISSIAIDEANANGLSAFQLLDYVDAEDIDSITRLILYNIDKENVSEIEIQNHVMELPLLDETSKHKALEYLSHFTFPEES